MRIISFKSRYNKTVRINFCFVILCLHLFFNLIEAKISNFKINQFNVKTFNNLNKTEFIINDSNNLSLSLGKNNQTNKIYIKSNNNTLFIQPPFLKSKIDLNSNLLNPSLNPNEENFNYFLTNNSKEYDYNDLIKHSDSNLKYLNQNINNSQQSNINGNSILINNNTIKKCRVLVLQGGGDKGAYQAGVIKGLSESLPEEERKWDVVTGISVGAINAGVLSLFEKGDEITAANFLVESWKNLKGSSDIYKNWFLGPIKGFFFESGFYNTEPMKEFVDKILSDKFKKIFRKIVIGATDIKSGNYTRFDEEFLSQNSSNFRDAIMASAAYPVIFPNIPIDDRIFMDGGVKAVVDIPAGIKKCYDSGFTADQVYLDMILCNAISITDYDKKCYNPIQILLRVLELYNYEKTIRDIQDSMSEYKDIKWRYLIKPNKHLLWKENPLDFTPEEIEELITLGIEHGNQVIFQKEGFYFKEFIEFYNLGKKDFFQIDYTPWLSYKKMNGKK